MVQRFFLVFLLSSFMLVGCRPKIVPSQLPITVIDKQKVKFYPAKRDFIPKKHSMVLLVISKSAGVSKDRLTVIQDAIRSTFEKNAYIKIIPSKKIDLLIKSDKYKNFEKKSVSDGIQLGSDLNATLVAQQDIVILESKLQNGKDIYRAKISLTVFTTGSRQIIFKKDIFIESDDIADSKIDLKKLVQLYFPLRAFVIESRGKREIAKITIGRNLGVEVGRKFLLRTRIVKESLGTLGASKSVSYSRDIVARVEVIEVLENESWVYIAEGDRAKIKLGLAAFSMPE
ncbi:MAG: hypothetical protein ACI86H_000133 [bacterium]|jgi:hypothetical protein